MHCFNTLVTTTLLIIIMLLGNQQTYAQKLLDKKVSVTASRKPIKAVLADISTQGGFNFSYISSTINNDSLITLSVHNQTVKQVLETIFGDKCQYKETESHIIIQPSAKEKWYAISGYITDRLTGMRISDVSVFERQTLASTLTNADGHFRLMIKESERYPTARITVSMGTFYADTTMSFIQGYDQHLEISLPPSNHPLQEVEISQYSGVERSWLGKHLFSSKLRKQSANLGKFFVDKPIQFSLTPGLGSHGKLSSQVTNSFSFNALGGYAAGVNGFELGGLFNIDKKDVKYVQIAGLFNVVSGQTEGVQIAGITNRVNDSLKGVQISGINSRIKGNVKGITVAGIKGYVDGSYQGFQLSGLFNKIVNKHKDTIAMEGYQLAGIKNKTKGNVVGVQMAGLINKADDVTGVQAAAVLNRAKRVRGVQIGFINIADTVEGYSIGFVNIVKKGYHTLCLSSNDVYNTNISFLGGNKKLYGIYTVSFNFNPDKQAFGLGYGIGTQRRITNRLAFIAELTTGAMYTGDTVSVPNIVKLRTGFNFEIAKKLSVHFGPTISLGIPAFTHYKKGYQTLSPDNALYEVHRWNNNVVSWIGWQVGVNIF